MTLSVDDQVTLVEAGVILIGIAITWAIYRRPRVPVDRPDVGVTVSGSHVRRETNVEGSAAE
jgi:hypothetical protein